MRAWHLLVNKVGYVCGLARVRTWRKGFTVSHDGADYLDIRVYRQDFAGGYPHGILGVIRALNAGEDLAGMVV
jgi:hypothetical protein